MLEDNILSSQYLISLALFQCWYSTGIAGPEFRQHRARIPYWLINIPENTILTQCWANVGPPSTTLCQHYPSIVSTSCVCRKTHSQRTRGVDPMLFYCWPAVFDVGPTLKQHCVNVSSLLGSHLSSTTAVPVTLSFTRVYNLRW